MEIRKALDRGVPSEMHRVAVLKRLYSWLISQGRIEPREDPTYRRLSAQKGKPVTGRYTSPPSGMATTGGPPATGSTTRGPVSTAGDGEGIGVTEGAFLACSFWLVDAYAYSGRRREAEALFERLLALRNDLGLLSEEYEPRSRRLVGNFPQAFSHLALIHSASVLSGAELTPRGGWLLIEPRRSRRPPARPRAFHALTILNATVTPSSACRAPRSTRGRFA